MSHFKACTFVAAFDVETFILFGAVEDGLQVSAGNRNISRL